MWGPDLRPGSRPGSGKPALGSGPPVGQGELESRLEELLDVGSANVFGLVDFGDADNVDRPETGTVAGGEVLVHLFDGLGAREGTVLLDHLYGQCLFNRFQAESGVDSRPCRPPVCPGAGMIRLQQITDRYAHASISYSPPPPPGFQ